MTKLLCLIKELGSARMFPQAVTAFHRTKIQGKKELAFLPVCPFDI